MTRSFGNYNAVVYFLLHFISIHTAECHYVAVILSGFLFEDPLYVVIEL